tara:strand:+ start:14442 stop:15734 length:1293 start_codon:yes stop_codon:yes gene_type:complete
MKCCQFFQKTLGLALVCIAATANAQQCDVPCDAYSTAMSTDFSHCLCERSTLLGDYLGKRSALAACGISYEGDVTQYFQGVTSGGLDQQFRYGLHQDSIYTFDMDKIAGAQGLFVKMRVESQYGDFVNGDTGAILPSNTTGMTPNFEGDTTAITNFTLTQFLSPTFAVFAGKLDTLDGDLNAYASGRGKTQFMNIGLVATPISFRTTPYSTWGFGFTVLGAEGTPVFTFSVIDPNDYATTFNLDDIFEDGVTLSTELRLPTEFAGRPGHHLFGGIWSDRDVALLSSAPLLILPDVALPTSNDSWALYWNFDQQLVRNRCDSNKGWGVFGRAGFADADTNPIEWFLSFGIGGDSPIAGRENDTFGAGWFYAATSDELPGVVLDDYGAGVEFFYNYEVTPWMHLTPDVQIIDAARGNVDNALVVGGRLSITL